MKITTIKLNGFRSHVKTVVSGLKRINIFVGPNGAGKSTILDAIGYALTGVTRGVDEGGRGADQLACQLAGPKTSTTVSLGTDKGEILRGLGQGPKSQAHIGIVGKLALDQKVLRVLSAPTNLLRLPGKKQEEIFFSMTGASVTTEAIAAALTAGGIDLESTPVELEELLTPEGRSAKLAYWKQRRVDMKHEIQGLVFTPSEQELPEADEKKRIKLERDAAALTDAITRGKSSGDSARQSIAHFDELVKTAEDKVANLKKVQNVKGPTAADVKKWQTALDEKRAASDELIKKRSEFSAASDGKTRLQREAERIKSLGKECSQCGQEITKAATDKKLNAMRSEYQAAIDGVAKLSGEIKVLEKKVEAVDTNDFLTKINAATRVVEDNKRNAELLKAATAELTNLKTRRADIAVPEADRDWSEDEARLADLKNQVEALKAAEAEAGRQLSVNTRRSEIEDNLACMELMLKAVGPGGTVQAAMSSGGTEEMVKAVRDIGDRMGVGDIGVELSPWKITLNGRDVELASASEEFRVAAAFGIAFAKKAGASIVLLDGAEILRGDNRNLFQDLIFSCDLEQIFVAFASDNIPESYEAVDGLSMYAVSKDERGASSVKAIKEGVAA